MSTEVHVHVHLDITGGITEAKNEIKETIVATKEEILASLEEAQALATETQKDVLRVIAKLDEALAAQDLTAVADAVAELKASVQSTDDAAEAAAPEEPSVP